MDNNNQMPPEVQSQATQPPVESPTIPHSSTTMPTKKNHIKSILTTLIILIVVVLLALFFIGEEVNDEIIDEAAPTETENPVSTNDDVDTLEQELNATVISDDDLGELDEEF